MARPVTRILAGLQKTQPLARANAPHPAPAPLRAKVVVDGSANTLTQVQVVEHTDLGPGAQISSIQISRRKRPPGAGYALAKRSLDLALTIPLALGAAPLLAGVALAIKLEDGGPVFFSQPRAGENGRAFNMLKFRSMSTNAEALKLELLQQNESAAGVIFKMRRDPRITKVGRTLRRFSLDELPQLFNVLRGDMSLVGPRPHPVEEAATYPDWAQVRLAVKPGITCLWQVMGRSLIPFDEQMKLDELYVHERSVALDLRLLLRTAGAVVTGRGAF